MKQVLKFTPLMFAVVLALSLTSCGGGGAKAAKVLQKVVSGKTASKAAKAVGQYGDDVARHVSVTTVTCSTCQGLKQVDFVDDDGNYLYTGDCPDCDGTGKVKEYGFK